MSENDRQALNIANKVAEYNQGLISSEQLVGYMLKHQFVFDDHADKLLEEDATESIESNYINYCDCCNH